MTARAGAPVRVGVIGCGTIAYWGHLRSLQRLKGAALAAAADPAPAARARAAGMVHGPIYERAADLPAIRYRRRHHQRPAPRSTPS